MITLCTPTRGRPSRFVQMVNSAFSTAANNDNVQIAAWLDEEDVDYPVLPGVVYGKGPRPLTQDGFLQMSGLWNRAWEIGSGDIAMMCADDVVFETPGWDEMVQKAFDSVPDRIVMVSTRNGQDDRPILPFVSREWIDVAGFAPEDWPGWFSDEWIWSMAAELGRVIFLPDVMIRHNQFGYDATYTDAMSARENAGGFQGLRKRFNSIPEVEHRDLLVKGLRDALTDQRHITPTPTPTWLNDSLQWNAEAREHAKLIREHTRVVVHCYAGDKELVRQHLSMYKHHDAKLLVLSPENAPVRFRGIECRQAGEAGYFGQPSLDRQRKHLEILLEYPEQFFLLNDADSLCLDPVIPRYLYEEASRGVVFSNEVVEWRPHASPYPKIAMQPPYFLSRDAIRVMLGVADRDAVRAHPVTPFIDWYMLALTEEAHLIHKNFPDGASFPAWRRNHLPDTVQLGHNPKHKNDPKGVIRGDEMMRDRVSKGAIFLHSIKHQEVLEVLLKDHEDYKRRGAPQAGVITMEEYIADHQHAGNTVIQEYGPAGMTEGETIRI